MKMPLNVKMPSVGKASLKMPAFKSLPKAAPDDSEEAKNPGKAAKTRLIAGTALAVFAIGFVMQNFVGGAPTEPAPAQRSGTASKIDVSNVVPTAATTPVVAQASLLPSLSITDTEMAVEVTQSDRVEVLANVPNEPLAPAPLEVKEPIQTASVGGGTTELPSDLLAEESVPLLACEIDLVVDAAPAATVDLVVDASCLPNERMTVHHNGMMFTAVTDDSGWQSLRVPALSKNAVYIVSFANGEGAVGQIDVPTLEFYDRVVVQWRGEAGLGLHALEFGAEYFSEGHVHAETAGNVAATANGVSGFLMRYGENAGPEALMAEVYTFPSGTAKQGGDIGLSVEAEVTAANCGTEVAAQTLQIRPGKAMKTQDLELFMPECDAVGDFLVLNNLLEDLKVASN